MIRILVFLLCWPLSLTAQTIPAPLSDGISDYIGVLESDTEARLNETLQAARDETGIHIAVAVIGRASDYDWTGRFADLSTQWFNTWGLGDATRNDGILMLIATTDREMRITLGAGYDVIWDGRAQRVIDTAMLPSFRNEDYPAGIEAGIASAIEHLARPFAAKEEVTEDSGFPEEEGDSKLVFGLFALVFGGFFVWDRFGSTVTRGITRFRRCPSCGTRHLHYERRILRDAGETIAGKGVKGVTCSQCGYENRQDFTLPSKAEQRSRSRSSGTGGGRSSGGGASGKW
jgi:uncharacterized protein